VREVRPYFAGLWERRAGCRVTGGLAARSVRLCLGQPVGQDGRQAEHARAEDRRCRDEQHAQQLDGHSDDRPGGSRPGRRPGDVCGWSPVQVRVHRGELEYQLTAK